MYMSFLCVGFFFFFFFFFLGGGGVITVADPGVGVLKKNQRFVFACQYMKIHGLGS